MKRNFYLVFIFFFSLFSFVSVRAAETYTIDPMHSYVLYHINRFGFSIQVGKWFTHGTIVLDKEQPQRSKVNVTIPVANVDSGIPELDKHLKGSLFFDVEKFPNATFVSNKITLSSKTAGKIYGILTLHGVSKPVVLTAKLNKMGINEINNKMTVGFGATTKLKRSDFGINALLPNLGDDVTIDIQVEAYQTKS